MRDVCDTFKSGLDQWVISTQALSAKTDEVAARINKYCDENNCTPVQVSIAYNSKAFGGAIEAVAIVKKNET